MLENRRKHETILDNRRGDAHGEGDRVCGSDDRRRRDGGNL